MEWEVVLIPTLRDNYSYLVRVGNTTVLCVDPSDAAPVFAELQERGWTLDYIFNTHHHYDHTDGNTALKESTGAKVFGFEGDQDRIPAIDITLKAEQVLEDIGCQILLLNGHTTGHIGFYFPEHKSLFCGDVLFSLGCGRVFEGSYEDAFNALQKIRSLPLDTKIYCGHEYTKEGCAFALHCDPNNEELKVYCDHLDEVTIPTTLALEWATNPFLRCNSVEIKRNLGLPKDSSELETFIALRKKRDVFV